MKCPNCGFELPEGSKFCSRCGVPFGEPTAPIEQPIERTQPLISIPAPGTPPLPSKGTKKNTKLIAIIVACVVVLGGIAGVAIWQVTGGTSLAAEVTKFELRRHDGGELDLQKLPVGKELDLEATFIARYGKGGKGTLTILLLGTEGAELTSERYRIPSKEGQQKRTLTIRITEGTGESLEAKAELEVSVGKKVKTDTASIGCRAVEGVEEDLSEAEARAREKLTEADRAVQTIAALGIEAQDLIEEIADAELTLEEVSTPEEANAIYELCERAIAECNARHCKNNQETLRGALLTFYNSEGNFPDRMEQLVELGFLDALPLCPSGGSYSYEVTDFNGPTFEVTCTTHGSL